MGWPERDEAASGDPLATAPSLPRIAASAALELSPGDALGNYTVVQAIASGGCGRIYEVRHALLGRPAAIKLLHPQASENPESVRRFVNEAKAANLIGHPAIVDVYEFDWTPDGRPYFVMELLAGPSLADHVRELGRRTPEDALEILDPILGALEAAHARGIIHRDVKPSNIVVLSGEVPAAKLVDFGIAKLLDPAIASGATSLGRKLGTPVAMAPEQIRGETVDARADVYALGVVLYFTLTGEYPFHARETATLERLHLEQPPPRPSARAPVGPALDAVVLRALAKEPRDRFASVGELATALRGAVRGARGEATEPAARRGAVVVRVESRSVDDARAFTDEDLADCVTVIDLARAALCDRYEIAVETGERLVAAALVTEEEDRRTLYARARADAEALAHRLAVREARVRRVFVVLEEVDVALEPSASGLRPVWPPSFDACPDDLEAVVPTVIGH